MKNLLLGVLLLSASGCSSLAPITSAQAVAIGQPLVAGGLTLVLQKNPSYVSIAQKVGSDLTSANWADLTLTGINATVRTAVLKEGGSVALAAVISDALDAGLAGYLDAISEATLAKDPNAVLVLQALGSAITAGANAASS